MRLSDTLYEFGEDSPTAKVAIEITDISEGDGETAISMYHRIRTAVEKAFAEHRFENDEDWNEPVRVDTEATDDDVADALKFGLGSMGMDAMRDYYRENHPDRLAGAQPRRVPADAERDENGEAVFDAPPDDEVLGVDVCVICGDDMEDGRCEECDGPRKKCGTCNHYHTTSYEENGDDGLTFKECPECDNRRPECFLAADGGDE